MRNETAIRFAEITVGLLENSIEYLTKAAKDAVDDSYLLYEVEGEIRNTKTHLAVVKGTLAALQGVSK